MKKKYFLFTVILCIAWATSLIAAPISRSEAKAKAEVFMAKKGWTLKNELPRKFQTPSVSGTYSETEPLTYIFNAADEKGFVIVSGDDATVDVLGYCDNMVFDEQSIPSNLMGWLVGTQEQIAYAREHGLTTTASSVYHEAISPLVTSRWGQDAPYNAYCPTVGGQRTPTGCLATALAQIMYYHRWPQESTLPIPSYTTNTHHIEMQGLPSITFDWTGMRDSYGYSSHSGHAVAELMQYCGQLLEMDYSPGGSGAHDYYLPELLNHYFGYYPSARYEDRSWYNIRQWDDLVYNELANQRPVLYCGYTPNWEGHAFVCDGYDGNGLYHINWGWDGRYDGYFRLSVLNPGTTTTTGSASTDDGFSEGQNVIIGIQTEGPDTTLPYVWPIESFTGNGNEISATIRAYDYQRCAISLLNLDAEGNMTEVFDAVELDVAYDNTYTVKFDVRTLAVGEYTLVPAMKSYCEGDWQRLGGRSYYADVVVGEGSEVSVQMHPQVGLDIKSVTFPADVVPGTSTTMIIDVQNTADDFEGKLYVFCGEHNEFTRIGSIKTGLLQGESFSIECPVEFPKTDAFNLYIATDRNHKNIIYTKTIHRNNLSIVSSEVVMDPMTVTAVIGNNTENDYDGPIITSIYQNGSRKVLSTKKQTVHIDGNGTVELQFQMNLDVKKKYYFTFQYAANEYVVPQKEIEGRVDIDFSVDGIDDVHCSDADSSMPIYNLSGQRVEKGHKGIVVHKGKVYFEK